MFIRQANWTQLQIWNLLFKVNIIHIIFAIYMDWNSSIPLPLKTYKYTLLHVERASFLLLLHLPYKFWALVKGTIAKLTYCSLINLLPNDHLTTKDVGSRLFSTEPHYVAMYASLYLYFFLLLSNVLSAGYSPNFYRVRVIKSDLAQDSFWA